MIKKIFLNIILIVICSVSSQAQFTINIYNNTAVNKGKYIFLKYKTTEKKIDSILLDSTVVTLKGEINNPAIEGNIYFTKKNRSNSSIIDSKKIFLENGTITIHLDSTIANANISGTPANDDAHILYTMLQPYKSKYKSNSDKINTLDKLADSTQIKQLKQENEIIFDSLQQCYKNFIVKNPNTYAVFDPLQQLIYTQGVQESEKYYNVLNEKIKKTPQGDKLKQLFQSKRIIAHGQKAPDFVLPDKNGHNISLSDYKGKFVLIDFWASWCGPCRAEFPALKKLYKLYSQKGFEIIGISLDSKNAKDAWLKAMEKDDTHWVHVSDLSGFDNKVAVQYGIQQIPHNVLIDKTGTILKVNLHGEELEKELKSILD